MSNINRVKNYKYSIFSKNNRQIKKLKTGEKKVSQNRHLYILLLSMILTLIRLDFLKVFVSLTLFVSLHVCARLCVWSL